MIVVAPPGALAEEAREAPVARYQGVLKGLVWCAAGLYYGVLAPDQATFQVWEADPLGGTGPTLLWSYPYASFLLKEVSPDGRYAWVGAALVDLVAGHRRLACLLHQRPRRGHHDHSPSIRLHPPCLRPELVPAPVGLDHLEEGARLDVLVLSLIHI